MNINDIRLERYWNSGGEESEASLLPGNEDELVKYYGYKTLDFWRNEPLLFLIGQAGAGKSTYLRTFYLKKDNSLYVDLNKDKDNFIEDLDASPNWINFLTKSSIETNEAPHPLFTIILDGWDELLDYVECLRRLNKFLKNISEDKTEYIRIRISSRPGIKEKAVVDFLKKDCQWLVRSITDESHHRLILAPLCIEQVRLLWDSLNIKSGCFNDFWNACKSRDIIPLLGHIQTLLFLMRSFSNDATNWSSLPELYYEMLKAKIKEDDNRQIDTERTKVAESFDDTKRIDCLGELALFYLLGGRKPIPHPDTSNGIFTLPSIGTIKPDTIRFLLSTSIFKPGGIENIHFAQSQEAEYLAARIIFKRNISIDKIRGLLVYEKTIAPNLQDLSKWFAKFNKQWLEYITEYFPNIAIQSLDNLMPITSRDNIIKKWWKKRASYYSDWGTIAAVRDLIGITLADWYKSQLVLNVKNKNEESIYLLLKIGENVALQLPELRLLQNYLKHCLTNKSLYSKILSTLGRFNFGEIDFWKEVATHSMAYEYGKCISTIINQLQRNGMERTPILQYYKVIDSIDELFYYKEHLYQFFRSTKINEFKDTISWLGSINNNKQSIQHTWLESVVKGLLEACIENKHIKELVQIGTLLWSWHDSISEILSENNNRENKELFGIVKSVGSMILNESDFVVAFTSKGYYRDSWIFGADDLKRVLIEYDRTIRNNGDSSISNHLFYLLRSLSYSMKEYDTESLEILVELKNYLVQNNKFIDSGVQFLIGPWPLDGAWTQEAKNSHNLLKGHENERIKREEERRSKKGKAIEAYHKRIEEIKYSDWYEVFLLLSQGYSAYECQFYQFIHESVLDEKFWKVSIKQDFKDKVIKSAINFIREIKWEEEWSKDFSQKAQSKSYNINYKTFAPFFAWKLIWHYRSQEQIVEIMASVNKLLLLKYFIGLSGLLGKELTEVEWSFLTDNITTTELDSTWHELEILQNHTVRLPYELSLVKNIAVENFIANFLSTPFRAISQQQFLSEFIQNNGPDFLFKWFDCIETKNEELLLIGHTTDKRIFELLLQNAIEQAWSWLLVRFKANPIVARNFLQSVYLSRHSVNARNVKNWSIDFCLSIVIMYYQLFPPKDDPERQNAYTPDWIDNAIELRNLFLELLITRADINIQQVFSRLHKEIKGFDTFGNIRHTAKNNVAQARIPITSIRDMRTLLVDSDVLIINEQNDFSSWIAKLLEEFDKDVLNGKNGLSSLLWNQIYIKKKMHKKSKPEDALSDLIYQWLKWRTTKNAILRSAREPQIKSKSLPKSNPTKKEKGKRLDLELDLINPNCILNTVIEVKKSENKEWENDGLYQLKDYLELLNLKSGVYVVGRYSGFKPTAKKMMATLRKEIKKINKDGYTLYPVVLDM
ncbi:MAG: hypothetical protein JNL74_02555 [Fibrobacteres bacterium]|nr:hypothetical protein [Fibrobacterota bacterium]